MIMQTASLYGIVESDGDYGKVKTKQLIKSIGCFLSFGTGSVYANSNMITQTTTHTAQTQDSGIQAGMWLVVAGMEYLISAVNRAGRFTVLYLQQQGGVSNAN